VELALAEPVMVELKRILTVKLGFDPDRWSQAEELLSDIATITVPTQTSLPAISGEPDDDLILACAIAGAADVLVSGDRRHLLPLGTWRGVRIVTPQALLAELRRN
jgi:uncharacterized protein